MIAACDNTFLTLLLNEKAVSRPNPSTGKPAEHCRARIESLVDDLSTNGGTLIVPSLVLAECLCHTTTPEAYMNVLSAYASIEVASFNKRAAYELSKIISEAQKAGDKRSGEKGNWQHVKMDRAIVAVAVVYGARTFYTDDDRQANFAKLAGLSVLHTWDLPISQKWAQTDLQEISDKTWPHQKAPDKLKNSKRPPAS